MVVQRALGFLLSALFLATPVLGREVIVKAPKPTGHPEAWVTLNDYPLDAYNEGKFGKVGFRLQVDVTGNPTNCEIIASSQDARLDQQTCRLLLQRAKFKPALDMNKKPVAGVFESAVHWVIPY